MRLNKLVLLLTLTTFLICPAYAEIVNITVAEDCYINEASKDTNYGTVSNMSTIWATGVSCYPLLKFNVPEYTEEAYLYIYCVEGWGFPHSITVNDITNGWDENTLTWNNQPNLIGHGASESLTGLNTWMKVNVTSMVQYPGNYSFRLRNSWGHNDVFASKEYNNGTYAAYLEIHAATAPADINWNNYTNNDSKAFTVNTGDVIGFNIKVPDSENITDYNWYVNKTNQSNDNEYFDFTVPSFDVSRPYTGIWEIRVEGRYKNGSSVVREWLVSGLTEEQAPDFIDSFFDQDNRNRWMTDPWGRELPFYTPISTNLISNGYYSNSDTQANVLKASVDYDNFYGTIRFKIKADGTEVGESKVYLSDDRGNYYNWLWYGNAGDSHAYFAMNANYSGTGLGYYPISKRWFNQAPGVHSWATPEWRQMTIMHTPDGYFSMWDNGSIIPNGYLKLEREDALSAVKLLILHSSKELKMDNIEIYQDRYVYPQNEIKYGEFPLMWHAWNLQYGAPYATPVLDNGIIIFGRGLTLKQISDGINNASLMTYDDGTKTATIKTNLFIKAGAELNITDETLIFDTTGGSKYISPRATATLRIANSTVKTNSDNPLIWNFASTISQDPYDPEGTASEITNGPRRDKSRDSIADASFGYRGIFTVSNSTIDNSCNIFLEWPQDFKIVDTVFKNMSTSDYGSYYGNGGEDKAALWKSYCTGNKSLWISPTMEVTEYNLSNITFVNPKQPVNLRVLGGAFVLNYTTIKNSDLRNINVGAKKNVKHGDFVFYYDPSDPGNVSLLNCKYNESNISVDTDRASVNTKYYADVVVTDSSGNPVQNAVINITSSNPSYPAENLTSWIGPNSQAHGPGRGPGEGGLYNTLGQPITGWDAENGYYFRWWDSLALTSATTDSTGRTAFPGDQDTENAITLIDKVWTNETGIQSKESIRYSLKVSPPNSEPFYIQDIDPDSTWYREDPLISSYTITAVTPDDSTGPNITGFAPSKDNPFEPGEKKILRVWIDENLTEMNWTIDGETLANGTLNYTWIVSEGYHEIRFSGKNANGNVSHVWNIGKEFSSNEPDANQTSIPEFLPEGTTLTMNKGEFLTLKVVSDQLLDSSWFINGKLISSGTESITQSWNTPGVYNVTFSGSTGGEQIPHTWIVNVTGSPELQNESIVRIDPEYQVVSPGEPFTLDIQVEPGTTISGAQFDLYFKDSMVKVDAVNEGNLLIQGGTSIYFSNGTISSSDGLIRHVYGSILGELNVSSPGSLAVLNLTASNSTGVAEFNLSNVMISDSNSNRVPSSIKNSTLLIDTAPELNLIGSKSVNETENLTFKVSAKDADRNILAFSASGLPEGADFDLATGVFTWIPSKGQVGTYTVIFEVSDGYLNDSENVEITVIPSNNAPSIVSFEPASGSVFNEGENITISLNASDSDSQALSYVIKIDETICSISPSCVWNTNYSSSGNHTIELIVSDGIEEVKKTYTIYITDSYPRWDVNQDGVVDIRDVTMVSRKYGTITKAPYPKWDVNQDGIVDTADLDIVNSHFGEKVK